MMGQSDMAQPKQNKHEIRTRETRGLLLRAAEQIFLRDGYEQAELGEIATLAGRTKGAIYAQFKSKEDIFLALVETHSLRRRAEMRARLAGSDSVEGNIAIMREEFLAFTADETWALLLLEFKLYAIRHPESKERLRQVYDSIALPDPEAVYTSLLGAACVGPSSISRAEAVHAGFSMLSGLIVEMRSANHVDGKAARIIAGRVFDALLEISPGPDAATGKAAAQGKKTRAKKR